MKKFDHFDFLAPIYDNLFKLNDPERIIRYAKLPVKGSLLDAGGGTGRIGKALKPLTEQVVIADASIQMLKQASQIKYLRSVCTLSEFLAFKNDSFDRVVIVDALHHVINAPQTCKELWRVLKPGGRIVIEEPDIGNLFVKILYMVEKFLLMRSRFYSPEKISGFFDHSSAEIHIERHRYNAWIIIDKQIIS